MSKIERSIRRIIQQSNLCRKHGGTKDYSEAAKGSQIRRIYISAAIGFTENARFDEFELLSADV